MLSQANILRLAARFCPVKEDYSRGDMLTWRFSRYPAHIANSLKIMLEAPIGSANFNNEYGRPCLTGFFRTLLTKIPVGDGKDHVRGYHKVCLSRNSLVSRFFLLMIFSP